MLPEAKKDAALRLRRIAGQVSGIQRMIDEDKYCVDVLTQIAAARAAMDKVGLIVLKSHLESCVAEAVRDNRTSEAVEEVHKVLQKLL
ncbi:MAG: transcriptional regulator [Actinobacteria bacterium]|nr:MAG: transcriptional regulator [Actinomycetota bacterium]